MKKVSIHTKATREREVRQEKLRQQRTKIINITESLKDRARSTLSPKHPQSAHELLRNFEHRAIPDIRNENAFETLERRFELR